jgi:polysaccharide export outer membrane protein
MAHGETRVAAVKDVAVFRTINGQRMGAMFDIGSIRRGEASDPELVGNDVVVVGFSAGKSVWRDVLQAAPLMNVFRPLAF